MIQFLVLPRVTVEKMLKKTSISSARATLGCYSYLVTNITNVTKTTSPETDI